MYGDPAAWHRLAGLLAEVVGDYLRAQVEAGAQALQLFDSWVGALDEADYREFALPHVRTIFAALRGTRRARDPLRHGDRPPAGRAARSGRRRDRPGLAPSPGRGLAPGGRGRRPSRGTWTPRCSSARCARLLDRVDDVLRRAAGRPGHVFNLGHGVLPATPVENVHAVVEHVHERDRARMKAVLLLAHGTPDSLDEMPEYLTRVRGGRPPAPELWRRCAGTTRPSAGARRSPTSRARRRRPWPASWAADAASTSACGTGGPSSRTCSPRRPRTAAPIWWRVPLAPQYSTLSRRQVPGGGGRGAAGGRDGPLRRVLARPPRPPGRLRGEGARGARAPARGRLRLHRPQPSRARRARGRSLSAAGGGHRGRRGRAGRRRALTAWPTRARAARRSPGSVPPSRRRWTSWRARAWRAVVVAPIGFVCDHTEVLYDIDVAAADAARRRGIALSRTASLNTSPTFIRALADVVRAARG